MNQPLKLVTEEADVGVKVLIVGDSDVACAVEYELEVQSGEPGKANRSVQRGKTRLQPNHKVTVAKAVIGSAPSAEWEARLRVTPCSGDPYEISRGTQRFEAGPSSLFID